MRVRPSILLSSLAAVLSLTATPARAISVTSACAAVLTDLEKEWGATGEWRKLAPYPVERVAARDLGIRFTALVADADSDEAKALVPNPQYRRPLESLDLIYRDATIHYPTVLYYRDGRISGSAIPGYKNSRTYVTLARERF